MEIVQICNFAWNLFNSCKAAEGEFAQISTEVLSVRTTVEMVRMECEDPDAIINKVDTKEKMILKKLRFFLENCERALKDVEKALKRYQQMNFFQKGKWALSGKEEIEGLKSSLSASVTALASFTDNVTRQAVNLVNNNVEHLADKLDVIQMGLGELEETLEKHNGNSQATIEEAMECRKSRRARPSDEARYRQVITDYVEEIKGLQVNPGGKRPRTPNAQRNKKNGSSTLGVTGPKARALSTGDAAKPRKSSPSPTGGTDSSKKYTLECWLVQVKTTDLGLFSTKKMIKEKMTRGQCRLEQMADQFKSSKMGRLAFHDELVRWVLADRKKEDTNSRYTWHAHAAKIEDKDSSYLGLKIEHQAMVIIRRQLTPEAQKRADEKELAAKKKRDAEKKKQEAEKKKQEAEEKKQEAEKKKQEAEKKKQEIEKKKKKDQQKKEAEQKTKEQEKKKKKAEEKREERVHQKQEKAKAEEVKKKQEEAERKQLALEIKEQQRKEMTQKLALQVKQEMEEEAAKKTQPQASLEGKKHKATKPSMPAGKGPCWFGDSCYNPNCEYSHETAMCQSNPCQNSSCTKRHAKGQKKATSAESK